MAIRVAINGFGRIGRAFIRQSRNRGIDIVAINDLGSIDNLAYLLKYDTVYGRAPFSVEVKKSDDNTDNYLIVDGKEIRFFSEKDPENLPWREIGIDVVIESTGFFTEYEKAEAHIKAGAKRVVISAPGKGSEDIGATILMGINQDKISSKKITSNGSCTTNAVSPIITILDKAIGIEKAILSTTHAYTASQSIVDSPSKKDMKEGRTAGQNIVPTSTGAATAVTKAYKELDGKFDGISLRVPVPAGSIADITFIAKRHTTIEEVNDALRNAEKSENWKGIFKTTDEDLVSSDIIGEPYASIADLGMTRVVDGTLVKVLAWYDNEIGYTETLVRHILISGNLE